MADEKTPDQKDQKEPCRPYSKEEQIRATKKMFEELSRLRGGNLILGCCTQGCCE
jgi:hypothetical protein